MYITCSGYCMYLEPLQKYNLICIHVINLIKLCPNCRLYDSQKNHICMKIYIMQKYLVLQYDFTVQKVVINTIVCCYRVGNKGVCWIYCYVLQYIYNGYPTEMFEYLPVSFAWCDFQIVIVFCMWENVNFVTPKI